MQVTVGTVLRQYAMRPGARLDDTGAAEILILQLAGATLTLTVAAEPIEWFIHAVGLDTEIASDWCDYTGYDDTPLDQLRVEMAKDIAEFLDAATTRALRFVRRGTRALLEWEGPGGGDASRDG